MKKSTFILPVILGLLLLNIQPARADVLDSWTTNSYIASYTDSNGFAFDYDMKHIVYGNGNFVAYAEYGDSGALYSSPDGSTWTMQYHDRNSWGMNLVNSSGGFMGVGAWEYAISPDGTNWNVQFVPGFSASGVNPYWSGIAWSGSSYVMVGDTNNVGAIVTSTDGTNWTYKSASSMGAHISTVAYGPGAASGNRFVAIGSDGYVYTAPRLENSWSRSGPLAGGSTVSFGNGLFFVPLNNETNLISADGVNWTPKLTGLTNLMGTITYANGIYLAHSWNGSTGGNWLATSTDGTNWLQYAQALPVSGFMDLFDNIFATDGTRLVALDNSAQFLPSYYYAKICYPLVGVRLTNSPAKSLALSGLVGRNYQIQSIDALNKGTWRTNLTLQLPSTPYVWSDSTATNSARFYRGVLMP